MISVYALIIAWSLLFSTLNSMFTNITKTTNKCINYHQINPLEQYNYNAQINLNFDIIRNNSTKTDLREIAVLTINKRYPLDKWLHVYTDGSVLNPEAKVGGFGGAGVYSKYFSYYMRVGSHTKNFDAEIAGVWMALKKLLEKSKKIRNVVILIDSNSTIRAIASNNTARNPRVYECRQILRSLECLNKIIVLQWIPSHCKIQGNCKAHSLARKATKELEKQIIGLSQFSIVKHNTGLNIYDNRTVINIHSNQTRFIVTANMSDVIIATKWSKIIIPANWIEVNITTSQTKFTINTRCITANIMINRIRAENNTFYKIKLKKENKANNFTEGLKSNL